MATDDYEETLTYGRAKVRTAECWGPGGWDGADCEVCGGQCCGSRDRGTYLLIHLDTNPLVVVGDEVVVLTSKEYNELMNYIDTTDGRL